MEIFLKVGYYVHIPDYKRGSGFCLITHREPILYEFDDYDEVADGAESGFTDIADLDPRDTPPELYQLLPGFEDGCDYFVKIPSGTDRYNPHRVSEEAHLDAIKSNRHAPNPRYQIWLVHGDIIAINVVNETGYARTSVVYFEGMKYNMQPLEETDARVKELRAGRLPYFVVPKGGLKT